MDNVSVFRELTYRGVPSVKIIDTAAQTLTTGVAAGILFNTDIYDRWGMHNVSSNTNRIVVQVPGIYFVYCSIQFEFHATGNRLVNMNHNQSDTTRRAVLSSMRVDASAANATQINVPATSLVADVGDYFDLVALQDSGGDLDLPAATTEVQTRQVFSAVWMSQG